MTKLLASVNSLAEAVLVESLGVDIIDLKQPALGALGALSVAEVKTIVQGLKPASQVSATIGDLPMQPEILCAAVQAMAETGVDYIKIGFFPEGDQQVCIQALSAIAQRAYALIAVLFADTQPDFSMLADLADAGFRGVMLDTMHKQGGSLTNLLSLNRLQQFVEMAKGHGLLSGLAGSLAADDIAGLLPLGADYLGFRGALCQQAKRTAELDEKQIFRIRYLVK